MLVKVGCALLCLPFIIWILGMLLYTVLPHVVFWLVVVGLVALVVALVVRAGQA